MSRLVINIQVKTEIQPDTDHEHFEKRLVFRKGQLLSLQIENQCMVSVAENSSNHSRERINKLCRWEIQHSAHKPANGLFMQGEYKRPRSALKIEGKLETWR